MQIMFLMFPGVITTLQLYLLYSVVHSLRLSTVNAARGTIVWSSYVLIKATKITSHLP